MQNPKLMTALVVGLGLGLAGAVYASDDCHVPMANWQPREAAAKMAESQGWTVRRIKVDDGCYEIKGRDASGREIEAKLDPQTLQVVEFEYEDDDDKKGKKKNKSNSSNTMAPQTPPDNGLFTPGTKPIVE